MSKKRPPKLKSIIPDEQRYQASIRLILNDLKKLTRKYVDPILEPVADKVEARLDDEATDIETAIGKVRSVFNKRFGDKDYERTALDSAKRVNKTNSQNHAVMMRTLLKVEPAKLEPWLDAEINLFVKNNASLIKTLPTETLSDIEQMLYRDSRRGLSPQELKKQIKEAFDATDSQAALIARDQAGKFNGSLTEIRQTKIGITEYEWLTSDDGRVRPDHDILNHTIQRWDKPPITVRTGKRSGERNHPSQDIQCFPADSKISIIGDVSGATRYYFTGELSGIITSEDRLIEATPNHPILTKRGWIAIKDIKVGDYLIEIVSENIHTGDMQQENMVSTIGEVFASINEVGVFESSDGIETNFHGDIVEGDVDTVFSARGLTVGGIPDGIKPVNDLFLSYTNNSFSAISDFNKSFDSYLASFNGGVSRFNSIHSLFFSHLRHAYNICFRRTSNTSTVFNKFCFNAFSGNSDSLGDRQNAFARNIVFRYLINIQINIVMWFESFFIPNNKSSTANFFAKVVRVYRKLFCNRNKRPSRFYKFTRVNDVSSREFHGYVYNLSTVKGWYAVNNIVSHNCRCQAIPVIPKLKKS